MVLAYVVANLTQAVFPAGPRADIMRMPAITLFALVLVAGPLTETLLFRCLPLEATAAVRARRSLRFAASIVPFAISHHFAGIPTVVAAGVVGGFYFAFTYERWRKESLMVAVGMTCLLHSSFNLVGVLGLLFLPQ